MNKLVMDPCISCGVERPTRKQKLGTRCWDCTGRTPRNTATYKALGISNITRHPLYGVWHSMKQRCYRKKRKDYSRYGGRGITVCREWYSSAFAFVIWSHANGYRHGLEIDRIDNDGSYSPDNCEWVTPAANVRKSSMTKLSIEVIPAISWFIRMGYKDTEIGATFFVHRRTISDIRRGNTWSDISGLGAAASA